MVLTDNGSDDSTVLKKKGKNPLSFMKKNETTEKFVEHEGRNDTDVMDNDLRNSELVFDQHR